MFAFSVGTVAAIINAIIAILQFVLPNALILTLVATLSETHTAATWSVVGRSIQSSLWPVLLRSDSAATKNVQLSSEILTILRPIALALVAIAAIVTPLGLYETVEPATEDHPVTFVPLADQGPFGTLTPSRSKLGFSRECSRSMSPVQCPGTNVVITYSNDGNTGNATIANDDYDWRIPTELAELYQSGLSSRAGSVSSFFDIEWRWYNEHKRDNTRNNPYTVDSYLPIDQVIGGDGGIKLIEGLIVDTRDGGIGFRNHTVPFASEVPLGAEWGEDILFLLPETSCVDTNITLEQRMPSEDELGFGMPAQRLIDRGGFIELSHHNPWDDGWYHNDTQKEPQLAVRAYRAAYTMNVFMMFFFGVAEPVPSNSSTKAKRDVKSHVGKEYPVQDLLLEDFGAATERMSLFTSSSYDELVRGLISPGTGNSSSVNTTLLGYDSPTYSNPFGITWNNFSTVQDACNSMYGGDRTDLQFIQVACGLALGPANKTEGPDTPLAEPESVWTRPVYSCASATKATIKTVRFSFNQTGGSPSGLDALSVVSLTDKTYDSPEVQPLWGLETADMIISSMTPFWGLIDPQQQHAVNLTTLRADHLYIPASSAAYWRGTLDVNGGTDYMPGSAAPATIWQSVYAGRDMTTGLQDLSGRGRGALAALWKKLSASSEGTAQIMNLLWTDLAANALIGTRNWLSEPGSLPPNLLGAPLGKRNEATSTTGTASKRVPVHVYRRTTRYRWIYAVPAAICLTLTAAICTAALVALMSGRGSVARIRFYLNRLSAGRLLMALQLGESDFNSDGKRWVGASGGREVQLPPGKEGYESVSLEELHVLGHERDIRAQDAEGMSYSNGRRLGIGKIESGRIGDACPRR